jgi:hypothetical protein
MNLENISALIFRLFAAYHFYWAIDDLAYMLTKQATDGLFKEQHYYACRTGFHIMIGLMFFALAVPLAKRIVKGLSSPEK